MLLVRLDGFGIFEDIIHLPIPQMLSYFISLGGRWQSFSS